MSSPPAPTAAQAPPLEPLEVASGIVFGPRREPAAPGEPEPVGEPRATLEGLLLEALAHPPCVVAFSGGRDSSAILAAATRVARAHGLDDPVPLTLVFPGAPRTEEGEWQSLVVRHLGLAEWSRRTVGDDELDVLAPFALGVLRRHGVHWPANAHTLALLAESAAGGSLVTGNGGDELFTGWRGHRIRQLRRARALPRRADLRPLLVPMLPLRILADRPKYRIPWLTPAAQREVGRILASRLKDPARSWAEGQTKHLDSRYREVVGGTMRAVADGLGVRLVEPFADARYVRAVVAVAPPEGYAGRTAAMETHFGDLLPPRVLSRSTKAVFTEVFTGAATRRFAADWDGGGVDRSLVEPETLRAQWLSPRADMRSLVPLQAAWLASV